MIYYAIGDVHGCFGHMMKMVKHIDNHHAVHYPDREKQIVFLGDYIDRGPDSEKVVRWLMEHPEVWALKGNHEDMAVVSHAMRKDVDQGGMGIWYNWLQNGGKQTLKSFGGDELPADVLKWMKNLPVIKQTNKLIFVHAGLYPGLTVEEFWTETNEDERNSIFLWTRGQFLGSSFWWGKLVLHGHTPTKQGPDVKRNRINLDTGAVFYGKLSCAVLDEQQIVDGYSVKDFLEVVEPSGAEW